LNEFTANASDGTYSYRTRDPGNYQLQFEGEGYQSATSDFTIPRDYSMAEVVVNTSLMPEEKKLIILRTVFFDFDRFSIRAPEKEKLNELFTVMNENPDLKLEIVGHTDAKGSSTYNKRLSMNRANSVIKYLTGKGISKDRLNTKGAGEETPIAINTRKDGTDAPRGRELNRRVEIHVLQSENKSIISEEVIVPEELKLKKE
jgi:outer membrane protein OmpA-like peptidoglycan-associated protein